MVIDLIKAHYKAYQKAHSQTIAFQAFVNTMSKHNGMVMVDSPYRIELENIIKDKSPELYDWYMWYLYEPNTFSINDTLYDANKLSLDEFLELVK